MLAHSVESQYLKLVFGPESVGAGLDTELLDPAILLFENTAVTESPGI